MREKFLGDTYDIVKRFWAQTFRPLGSLYAHARFIPASIRQDYENLTSIPIIDTPPNNPFGVLLDPDTGIPLPGTGNGRPTAKHSPLEFIEKLIVEWNPRYVITFDQSHDRRHTLNLEQQRFKKMSFLASLNIQSFYYVSHAPFLFCSNVDGIVLQIRELINTAGIPESRLEDLKSHH